MTLALFVGSSSIRDCNPTEAARRSERLGLRKEKHVLARRFVFAVAFVFLLTGFWQAAAESIFAENLRQGPLADYVRKPDPSYRWEKRSEGRIGQARYAELLLTSQTWKDIVWKHQLFVITPDNVDPAAKHAMLLIAGGAWNPDRPKAGEIMQPQGEVGELAMIATRLREPAALLMDVPVQPLFGNMYEDTIIAYTFDKYLQTGDSTWPLLLPMVKSAVRAMDAVQAFSKQNSSLNIEKFTVRGISKRGWTTWLTGAVDGRVAGIVPIVIDMLNMKPHAQLELSSFGHFAENVRDYTERHLQQRMNTPGGQALRRIVDPYAYLDTLTMPKLLMMGTNDPYWPLESANLYWNDLSGEKYLLYAPNEGHGFGGPRRAGSFLAFQEHVAKGKRLPKLSWKYELGATSLQLTVESDLKPQSVAAWTATANTRDFRDSKWTSQAIAEQNGAYVFALSVPEKGFAAVFGEARFANEPIPYFLSTNVHVVGKSQKEPLTKRHD
jgi:PhoPQ-activated pathogenicity-related protein